MPSWIVKTDFNMMDLDTGNEIIFDTCAVYYKPVGEEARRIHHSDDKEEIDAVHEAIVTETGATSLEQMIGVIIPMRRSRGPEPREASDEEIADAPPQHESTEEERQQAESGRRAFLDEVTGRKPRTNERKL